MRLQKRIKFIGGVILLLAALLTPFAFDYAKMSASSQKMNMAISNAWNLTPRVPMLLHTSSYTIQGGKPYLLQHSTYATKSDGSYMVERREFSWKFGFSTGTKREILRASDSSYSIVYDHVRMKSSTRLQYSNFQAESLRGKYDPATQCASPFGATAPVTPEVIGEEEVLGYKTFKLNLPAGNEKVTVWRAPELGCFQIKLEMKGYDKEGNLVDDYREIPLDIRLGEPDDSLLSVPNDYQEAPPSRMTEVNSANLSTLFHKSPPVLDASQRQRLEDADRKYYAAQRP
jgi:hypothetical protein